MNSSRRIDPGLACLDDFEWRRLLEEDGKVRDGFVSLELFVSASDSPVSPLAVCAALPLLQVGAICLSASIAAVDDDKWGLLAVENVTTSWGSTKLHVHEKLAA